MVHKYDEDVVLKKCPLCEAEAELVTVHKKRVTWYVCFDCAKALRLGTRV